MTFWSIVVCGFVLACALIAVAALVVDYCESKQAAKTLAEVQQQAADYGYAEWVTRNGQAIWQWCPPQTWEKIEREGDKLPRPRLRRDASLAVLRSRHSAILRAAVRGGDADMVDRGYEEAIQNVLALLYKQFWTMQARLKKQWHPITEQQAEQYYGAAMLIESQCGFVGDSSNPFRPQSESGAPAEDVPPIPEETGHDSSAT